MKTRILFMGFALVTMAFAGCGSSKQSISDMGNKEIELPCAGFDRDSKDYFTGMGIGENVNMQNARSAAFDAAKGMLLRKVGGMAKGFSTSYSKTMSGNAAQDDVQRIVEGEIATVVERMMNDVEQTCEKMYQTPAGTYQSHIAIRISKEELAQKTATALSENDKLRMEYDRERFRKFAEEYMKGLNEQGK